MLKRSILHFPGSEKHHYHILDGLRGVAAIVVVWFHIFEAYATSQWTKSSTTATWLSIFLHFRLCHRLRL